MVTRLYDFADDTLLPSSLPKALSTLPRFSRWADAVRSRESVTYSWKDEIESEKDVARREKAEERAKATAAK